MSQDTNVPNLVINKLTKEQYDGIANPDPTQLYMITDEVITDTDVTDALGYTPYDSSNPDGFISNAAVSSLSDVTLTSLSNGQALVYDSSSSKWINSTINSLPSQSGQSGKFLTTNGSAASWASVPTEIPTQTGQSGKILTTNGSFVSWSSLKTLNSTSLLGSGDITVLQNAATDTDSLTILGFATNKTGALNIGLGTSIGGNNGTAIGRGAKAALDATSVGFGADAGGDYSAAIGYQAFTISNSSVQLGYGTNLTANSLSVGFYNNSTTHYNWQLLDGTTGLIPDARLSSNIQRTLVSGTSIKTVNSTSLLGSGDIAVQPVISSSAMLSSDLVDDTNHTHKFATAAQLTQIATNATNISTINGKIPSAATSNNQLADKAFVNSSVQTATANFRGNWDTWSDVPSSASSYPADYAGSTTPTVNDYLVVQDASGYTGDTLTGTWRFKYSGTWSTDGKSGWLPEYQVNETPLTSAQIDALNSGITTTTKVTHTASTAVGSSTTPVYIASDGAATALSYTIEKSVPSNAVFTDTTYSDFTGATSIAGGAAGLVPAPSSGDNDKILTGGATWSGLKTVNSTSLLGSGNIPVLQNTATGSNALTLLGTACSVPNGINIGYGSSADRECVSIGTNATTNNVGVAIGYNTEANYSHSTALGMASKSTANGAIQIGYGTNSTANTLSIGFYNNSAIHYNWQLLDGTTGLIPDARISTNIARTSAIPTQASDISAADNTLSNVSSINSNSAVQTALNAKVNTADIWYDSSTLTLNIGVAQA